MATANAENVPVVPNFKGPPGNWIARNLRLVNEDSKQLFPSSAAGSRSSKKDKYHSLYKVDYHDYPHEAFLEGLKEKGREPKRETIRDVLFGNSPSEVFQGWKIPNRLVPEPAPDVAQQAAHVAVITGKRDRGQTRLSLAREQSLPVLPSSRQNQLISPRSPNVAPLAAPTLPIRAKTSIDGSELLTTKDKLRESLQPHTVTLADGWLKQAPQADRKVIEKVLRMQEKKHQLDNALRKSLLPDARKSVENWLDTATDSERQVALNFFSSVAGAKLMGSTAEEQKGRLQQVIRTLENNKGQAPSKATRHSLDSSVKEKESKLKYVNLLDSQTRANRWMHTTWHHLPEYRNDNPVNNWSSHYVRPHAPTPRHFVIHPDWG